MKRIAGVIARLLTLVLVVPLMTAPVTAQELASKKVLVPTDRTVLPIPEPKVPAITVFNARDATPPPRFQVKAPAGAPNVLIVLIDDMGFGMSGTFGGPISMPTLERLSTSGLRYTHFH